LIPVMKRERKGSHVLVEIDGRWAVLERRAGKIYNLKPGSRRGYADTRAGIVVCVGADGWLSRTEARRLFTEVTRQGERLAREMR
jgi:hypothetical protein